MRIILVCLFFLAGCAVQTTPVGQPTSSTQTNTSPTPSSQSAQVAVRNYIRIGRRIEAVAEPLCRRKNPSKPRNYCDFQVKIDTTETNQPNAFQTIGKDGRPIIAFNIPMLASVLNEHETAFILGHEAAHQISNHIAISSGNAGLGALIFGGLAAASGATTQTVQSAADWGGMIGARAYSQTHELEADVLGTYITHLAGFNPQIGARSFARMAAGGGGPLSTHPAGSRRLATVQATMARINADIAAGRPVQVP